MVEEAALESNSDLQMTAQRASTDFLMFANQDGLSQKGYSYRVSIMSFPQSRESPWPIFQAQPSQLQKLFLHLLKIIKEAPFSTP